jgi:hypothetical protein
VGSRVLLLEADLRRPTLARQLDVRSGAGLADVLIGTVMLGEATQTVALEGPLSESARGRTLDVLVFFGGSVPAWQHHQCRRQRLLGEGRRTCWPAPAR